MLLGEELFVQGRPFTRVSRQAPAVIRRLRRRGVEHLSLPARREPGGAALVPRGARCHRRLRREVAPQHPGREGRALRERAGWARREAGGPEGTPLATVRDRVAVIHECLTGVAAGRPLAVGELESRRPARSWRRSPADPHLLHHLAPWEGEERWQAVHAHNVAVVTMGLARLANVGAVPCRDLGLAALFTTSASCSSRPSCLPAGARAGRRRDRAAARPPEGGPGDAARQRATAPVALIVVCEHHLYFNGTGYPRLARPRRPHPAARLVTVADTFDLLFTARGGRGMLTREGTAAWLADRQGSMLDPDWAAALREVLAAPPPGLSRPGSSPRSCAPRPWAPSP